MTRNECTGPDWNNGVMEYQYSSLPLVHSDSTPKLPSINLWFQEVVEFSICLPLN